jgi:hypothetical protein
MLSFFWDIGWDGKKKYKIQSRFDQGRMVDLKQGSANAGWLLADTFLNLEEFLEEDLREENREPIHNRLSPHQNNCYDALNNRRLQLKSVSVNGTHLCAIYTHGWKYNNPQPQSELTAEKIDLLHFRVQNGNEEARSELLGILRKSLVIGGDTGKRSTFTLCYNFVQQAEERQEQRR